MQTTISMPPMGLSALVLSLCIMFGGCSAAQLVNENGDVCGDAVCSENENKATCPEDCGALCSDVDNDGVCDLNDNCPQTENAEQNDADMDAVGDMCDVCPNTAEDDADEDGICDDVDNCLDLFNQNQTDGDEDGIGNACDPCPLVYGGDLDGDELCDAEDNCPGDNNPGQEDTDEDGQGDICDPCLLDNPDDTDNDGVCDSVDACLGGDDQLDENEDGVADACENCDYVAQRMVVVSYEEVYTYSGEGPLSFQAQLHENGDIAVQYKSVHSLGTATVGIEAPGDGFAINYQFETINVPDETQLLFKYLGGDYEVKQGLAPDGPPFDWRDSPEDAALVELTDDASDWVSLPFAFPFLGRSYNRIAVGSNGYLWSGDNWNGSCCRYENYDLPTNRPWEMFIGMLWEDLNPEAGGTIKVFQDNKTCVQDCMEVWDGYAREDDCGTCTGGTSGLDRNRDKDCEGACFGEAFLDDCGMCSGGNTEHEANAENVGCGCFEPPMLTFWPDTDGDGLGAGNDEDTITVCRLDAPLSFVDNNDDEEPDCSTNDTALCGACGGLDCHGECDGGAYIDACNVCAGGSTGNVPGTPHDENNDGFPDDCEAADLVIDQEYMANTMFIDHVYVDPDDCYIDEGCVGGPGLRKVLRFGTKVGNQGNADLAIGYPGGDDWVHAACHDHYHFEDYAFYELITPIGRQITTVGYKNGWCVMDLTDWQDSGNDCDRYNCNNQGISAGCADIYASSLDCQWIDITTVLDGDYTVRVTTNPYRRLPELDYNNNTVEVTVQIEGDDVRVVNPKDLNPPADSKKPISKDTGSSDTKSSDESTEKTKSDPVDTESSKEG